MSDLVKLSTTRTVARPLCDSEASCTTKSAVIMTQLATNGIACTLYLCCSANDSRYIYSSVCSLSPTVPQFASTASLLLSPNRHYNAPEFSHPTGYCFTARESVCGSVRLSPKWSDFLQIKTKTFKFRGAVVPAVARSHDAL